MSEPSRTIPQRELRNQIGRVLREVHDEGKTIRVTVNGRPVADLVPVHQGPRVAVPGWELLRMIRDTPVDPAFATDIADMDEEIPVADPWEPS